MQNAPAPEATKRQKYFSLVLSRRTLAPINKSKRLLSDQRAATERLRLGLQHNFADAIELEMSKNVAGCHSEKKMGGTKVAYRQNLQGDPAHALPSTIESVANERTLADLHRGTTGEIHGGIGNPQAQRCHREVGSNSGRLLPSEEPESSPLR